MRLASRTIPRVDFSDIVEASSEQLRAMHRVGRPPLGKTARRLIAIRVDPEVREPFQRDAKRRKDGATRPSSTRCSHDMSARTSREVHSPLGGAASAQRSTEGDCRTLRSWTVHETGSSQDCSSRRRSYFAQPSRAATSPTLACHAPIVCLCSSAKSEHPSSDPPRRC